MEAGPPRWGLVLVESVVVVEERLMVEEAELLVVTVYEVENLDEEERVNSPRQAPFLQNPCPFHVLKVT